MSWLCDIKLHSSRASKGFFTPVKVKKDTLHAESWTGFECWRCGSRKLLRNLDEPQSKEATQNAYDWLNFREDEVRNFSAISLKPVLRIVTSNEAG